MGLGFGHVAHIDWQMTIFEHMNLPILLNDRSIGLVGPKTQIGPIGHSKKAAWAGWADPPAGPILTFLDSMEVMRLDS